MFEGQLPPKTAEEEFRKLTRDPRHFKSRDDAIAAARDAFATFRVEEESVGATETAASRARARRDAALEEFNKVARWCYEDTGVQPYCRGPAALPPNQDSGVLMFAVPADEFGENDHA